MPQQSTIRSAAVAAGAAAAGAVVWSTLIERRWYALRRYAVPVLPAGSAPLRVLQISDTHLAPWQHDRVRWLQSLSELRPDLVVLTGDLMGHLDAREALLDALSPVLSKTPAVFVHGSNDYYGPRLKNPLKYLREPSRLATRTPDIDTHGLTSGLERLGATNLNNAAARFTISGTELEFFGLNDPHIRYDDIDAMRMSLAAIRDGHPEASAAPEAADVPGGSAAARAVRIGIVHAPYQEALNALLAEGADLLLAGHTHGGQLRVPGVGALTSNCDLPLKQARGLSVWYDAHQAAFLHVSAGLGTSVLAPARFACRPEATLITLEPEREAS